MADTECVSLVNVMPYQYCDDCDYPFFQSKYEKYYCSFHWRPLSGTKVGFPKDGWNCPKDSWREIIEKVKNG